LEELEPRLAPSAGNVFAQFSGLALTPTSQQIPVTVAPPNFTLASGRATLGFLLQAAPGSTVDPAAVRISTAAGASVAARIANDNLSTIPGSSLTIVDLSAGTSYLVNLRSEGTTSGSAQLQVFLAGDAVAPFGKADAADGSFILSIMGKPSSYLVTADSNLDGKI